MFSALAGLSVLCMSVRAYGLTVLLSSSDFLSSRSIIYCKWNMQVPSCNCGFTYVYFQLCQLLLLVFCSSVVCYILIQDCCLPGGFILSSYVMSLFPCNFLYSKVSFIWYQYRLCCFLKLMFAWHTSSIFLLSAYLYCYIRSESLMGNIRLDCVFQYTLLISFSFDIQIIYIQCDY